MNLNKKRSEDKRKQEREIKQKQILEQRAIREKIKIKRNKYYNTELKKKKLNRSK